MFLLLLYRWWMLSSEFARYFSSRSTNWSEKIEEKNVFNRKQRISKPRKTYLWSANDFKECLRQSSVLSLLASSYLFSNFFRLKQIKKIFSGLVLDTAKRRIIICTSDLENHTKNEKAFMLEWFSDKSKPKSSQHGLFLKLGICSQKDIIWIRHNQR